MSTLVYRKIGIASLVIMGSVFLSRLLGIVREMVIAYFKGAGAVVDAYQVSFILPEILNHVIATGFLSISFIPIFTAYLTDEREEEGWKVFSNIVTVFGCLISLLILVSILFTPELISFTGLKSSKTVALAIKLTRIVLPAQFFFFVGGLLMAVQYAKEKFIFPAMAPLIYNAGIIAGGIALSPYIGMEGFSWGVLLGAFLGSFIVQLWGAKRVGLIYSPSFKLRDPELRKYIALTLPLMVGLTMTFSTEIFPKYFSTYLPEGSLSSLNYGIRILFLLVGFFGQAVGVASYPFFSQLAAKNDIPEMNKLLNTTLRHISLVIPFSALIIVSRYEIVRLLFQRGGFDSAATEMTSGILVYLLIGAFAFTAQTIVTRGFYAMGNTLLPTLFISLVVILTLPLYFVGSSVMGINGIALALSVSVIIQVLLLYYIWSRQNSNHAILSVCLFYLKMILMGTGCGIFLEYSRTLLTGVTDRTTFWGSAVNVMVLSTLFLVILSLMGYLLKIDELFSIFHRLTTFVKRPRKGDEP